MNEHLAFITLILKKRSAHIHTPLICSFVTEKQIIGNVVLR